MVSVTNRIKMISQPKGGYVPCSLFSIDSYDDYYEIFDLKANLSSIQGMTIDYLTRYMLTKDKMSAFNVSILGAKKIDEARGTDTEQKRIGLLLNQVNGLDEKSIIAACKIVCYDSAFRKGVKAFKDYEEIEFSNELYHNVPILVNRCLTFFDSIGGILSTEMTFEGGYTTIVSSGDGDYLSSDMIIDLKVSKNEISSKWSLQLLMYYLLGLHSIHKEYEQVNRLCIFNPIINKSYICNISDISDESKYVVSHDVLGYKMVYDCWQFSESEGLYLDYSKWQAVDGSDKRVFRSFLTDLSIETDFDVNNYGDGIFDITIDDYWTFLQTFDEYAGSFKPLFPHTASVKFIKRSKYYMFVSVSPKGKYSLLHGGRLHSLKYSLEYYYDYLEKYAIAIITNFSKYWDALRVISEQLKSLEPTEEYLRKCYSNHVSFQKILKVPKEEISSFDEWLNEDSDSYRLSGKIHGCIVDIDWSNHIYVNPLDGSVTPYNALSMYDKNVYKNVRSLLAVHRREMIPSFDKMIETHKENTQLITQNKKSTNISIISEDNEISEKFIKVYNYDMYAISNKLKPLQNIYDCGWILIWYDDILGKNMQLEDKYLVKKKVQYTRVPANNEFSYVGKKFPQKNGMNVTVIKYRHYRNVDVSFEDGTVVEQVKMVSVKSGRVRHPNDMKAEKKDRSKSDKDGSKSDKKEHTFLFSTRTKYIGVEKMMNCGMKATCIEYYDCKHLTVKFSDGMIKENIRADHFKEGKVSHKGGYYLNN